MASLRQIQTVQNKQKLSHTLRNWLPILHSNLADLGEAIEPFIEANPLVEIESGYEKKIETPTTYKSSRIDSTFYNDVYDDEFSVVQKKGLYDTLDEQINGALFPTRISQKIAYFIISNIDSDGYYDGDTEKYCEEYSVNIEDFEKIRMRFIYLEPAGICSKNLLESFLFQLNNIELNDSSYALAIKIINDFENIYSYSKEENFNKVVKIISTFNNPPAIDYHEESKSIIVDLMIKFNENSEIEVKLNNDYYPIVKIDTDYKVEHEYLKEKFKEAKSLADALNMRKTTLHKVGLMIVEYQYEFFAGGQIMPLKLQTLADEFGHNPSTISRAIANKYISCDRGIFAMKDFFTTAIDDDLSNDTIKHFLVKIIKKEDQLKPLSDMKIVALVNEEFKISIVRRTIAKYRKQLNIAGSSDRKKIYKLGL